MATYLDGSQPNDFCQTWVGKLLESRCLVGSLNTFGQEPLIKCIPEPLRGIRPFFSLAALKGSAFDRYGSPEEDLSDDDRLFLNPQKPIAGVGHKVSCPIVQGVYRLPRAAVPITPRQDV